MKSKPPEHYMFLLLPTDHSVQRIDSDSTAFKKKLLDKYIVRLCCVSGCFEAAVFLLFRSTTGQMCIAVGSLCHMVICLV